VTQQQRSFDNIVAREQGLRHALTSGQMAMIAIGGACERACLRIQTQCRLVDVDNDFGDSVQPMLHQ